MPQRTNEFQELVALIQRALLPEGASITESAMVETSDGRTTREIDILIDSAVGPYRIRVAVEAKRESRKMDEVGFDAIIGKYLREGGLRVNKIVVVALKGFTEGVVGRAKLLDIELVTLSEAKTVDWSGLKPPEACLRSAVDLIETEYDEETRRQFGGLVPDDAQIVCSCGWRYGAPSNYAKHLFWRKVMRENREDVIRVDDEVMEIGAEKKLKIAVCPGAPHQTFLEHGTQRIQIREFVFKIRFRKPEPTTLPILGQINFAQSPHVCRISFTPEIPAVDNRELQTHSQVKCVCCGRDRGTARQWAEELALTGFFNRNVEAQKRMSDGLKESPTGECHLIVTWPVPPKLRITFGGVEYSPQSVSIDIHAVAATGALRHEQYEMCRGDGSKSRVDSFEGVVGGKRLRVVMPEGLASKKIAVRIDDARPKQKLSRSEKSRLLKQRQRIDKRKDSAK